MRKNPTFISTHLYHYPFIKKINGRNVFFIHIPKTGGTSITHALDFPPPDKKIHAVKHYPIKRILPFLESEIMEEAFCFCFIRNPWDRMYSHYRFRKRTKSLQLQAHYNSFKDWLKFELLEHKKIRNLKPQLDWIRDQKGNISMDFIGRFEKLEADFQKVCKILQINARLPHLEAGRTDIDYRLAYDEISASIVGSFYKEDVDYFGYQFE